jgi:hypothetical protein
VALYDRIESLPLVVDSIALDPLQRDVSSAFTRRSTVVRLRGGGEEGIGEDVTYNVEDHEALDAAGPDPALEGEHTVESFSRLVESLDLFPEEPRMAASRHYRRWAFESAALDLALRQAGRSLADVLERESRPVRFVISMRLPDPPSSERVRRWLELYPAAEFKLDPTSDWTDDLAAELAATGAVRAVDLKGMYKGTIVDAPPDPQLYERVARAFPDALIEDPAVNDETRPVLEPHVARISWDEPIHSWADVESRPWPPGALNVKPSRFGSVRALFDTYERAAERGLPLYGGGQFELGPGRGQIQLLASLFHPDGPNDVAPADYNAPEAREGLPASPLELNPAATGFRLAGD